MIEKDVTGNCIHGPFTKPQMTEFVTWPLAIVPEKRMLKIRIINNLNFLQGDSVNDDINVHCSVKCNNVDDVVKLIQCYGPGSVYSEHI